MCIDCMIGFIFEPTNMFIILLSLFVAVTSFILIKKNRYDSNRKLVLIYTHIFSLLFPVIYLSFSKSCMLAQSECNTSAAILKSIPFTLLGTFILGFFIVPLFIVKSKKYLETRDTHVNTFIKEQAALLRIKQPRVYLLDIAKPVAYSFSNIVSGIVFSVGLLDILKRRELEAVLLHELGHIKYRSSFFKFSTWFCKMVSPLCRFARLEEGLNREEEKADRVAMALQGTKKHLLTAKRKVNGFYDFKG